MEVQHGVLGRSRGAAITRSTLGRYPPWRMLKNETESQDLQPLLEENAHLEVVGFDNAMVSVLSMNRL